MTHFVYLVQYKPRTIGFGSVRPPDKTMACYPYEVQALYYISQIKENQDWYSVDKIEVTYPT